MPQQKAKSSLSNYQMKRLGDGDKDNDQNAFGSSTYQQSSFKL
jgi:hypothetical protein